MLPISLFSACFSTLSSLLSSRLATLTQKSSKESLTILITNFTDPSAPQRRPRIPKKTKSSRKAPHYPSSIPILHPNPTTLHSHQPSPYLLQHTQIHLLSQRTKHPCHAYSTHSAAHRCRATTPTSVTHTPAPISGASLRSHVTQHGKSFKRMWQCTGVPMPCKSRGSPAAT